MQSTFPPPRRHRSALRLVPLGLLAALLGACGGDPGSQEATPEDVDQDTPVAVTDEERESFRPAADSVLTSQQVEAYLKTSLLQFDLIRTESKRLHEKVAKMEERGKEGGTLGGLRNLVEAGQTIVQVGDLVGGSYVRSARTLSHNPAELEWVRDRMAEVSGYLVMKPMYESSLKMAADMRAQAETMRKQLVESGTDAAQADQQVKEMLAAADQMEADARAQVPSGAVARNLEVLRRTKPAVTEETWGAIGISAGTGGLVALTGLADPGDTEAQKKLDEFRRVFEDAMANRATPKPAGQQ